MRNQSYGAKDEQIFFVGNVMIDTLLKNRSRFKPELWDGATSERIVKHLCKIFNLN